MKNLIALATSMQLKPTENFFTCNLSAASCLYRGKSLFSKDGSLACTASLKVKSGVGIIGDYSRYYTVVNGV